MPCLIQYIEGKIDWAQYGACIAAEIRTKVDSLTNLTSSQFNSTRNLISSSTNSLNASIGSASGNILSQINNSTTGLNNHISQSETSVKGTVNNGVATLANALAGKTSEIIGNIGNRLNQIRSESQYLQNLTVQQVTVNSNQQTIDLLNSIKTTGDSIKQTVIDAGSGTIDIVDNLTEGIGDFIQRIIDALLSLLQPLIDWANETIDNFLFSAGEKLSFFATQIGQFSTNFQEIIRRVQQGEYSDLDKLLSDLKLTNIDLGFYRSLLDIVTIVPLIVQVSTSGFRAFSKQLEYLVNEEFRTTLLTPDENIRAYIRGNRTLDDFLGEMRKWGYTEDGIVDLLNIAKPLLGVTDITQARLRGFISENDYDARLEQLGFAPEERNIIKLMRNQIPPIQDLITMSVREAFSPDIAESFGQYQDYPNNLTPYAAQHGLSEDWAKAYWASHWGLPSPTQGFEMLHRGIIDRNQLKNLLRALDIMPYWRDKVIDLSYTPLRLVDIRRFFEDGVINRDEMFNEYKSRGYDDKHALWATNWTIQAASSGSETEKAERRLLSQAVITKAFNSGRMTRNQAIEALVLARYTVEDANLLLDLYSSNNALDQEDQILKDNKTRIAKLATDGYGNRVISRDDAIQMLLDSDYTIEQANIELDSVDFEFDNRVKAHIVDWYKELYTTYEIDETDLSNNLGQYGFEQGEISRLIAEFSIVRETRTKKPSLEQFTRFFKKDIISQEQYILALKGLGYADQYIQYYLSDALE